MRGAFSNRAPIFFEQQRHLARARTMHSGFNKTATIRVKTARLVRAQRGIATEAGTTGTGRRGMTGRGYGSELYRRENGKAEGNLNEETRDNAWAKRPEQNGTPGRRGSILVVRQEKKGGGGEGERGWVKTTAESN